MAITKSSFGITSDGEEAFLYRLENTSGAYVTIIREAAEIIRTGGLVGFPYNSHIRMLCIHFFYLCQNFIFLMII